jgi:hypothetical protein
MANAEFIEEPGERFAGPLFKKPGKGGRRHVGDLRHFSQLYVLLKMLH